MSQLIHRPETLLWPQFYTIFFDHHFHSCKDATYAAALIRYILIEWQDRPLHLTRAQDTENLLKVLRDKYGQGGWQLIKARAFIRNAINKAERWKEDGGVGPYDFSLLQLPRRNPGKFSQPVKEPPPIEKLSPWEWRLWMRVAKRLDDQVLMSMIRIGVWGRLSPIDLIELNDDEIFDDAMEIRLYRRHTRTPRNPVGCLQVIQMTEKFWAEIERMRRFRRPGEKRIFPLTHSQRRSHLDRARYWANKWGINIRFRLQLLRRSGAQRLKDLGVDDKTNADGMGLTSTRVLERRYAVGVSPNLRRNTEQLVKEYSG
jgi:hypothetical protein